MLATLRRNARVAVSIGVMTALIGGPVIAGNIAPNADKVDGFHAVGAGTKPAKRTGKLVATNSKGRLPNNIIKKAPDANKLDGMDSSVFATSSDLEDKADLSELQSKADGRARVKVVDVARSEGSPDAAQSGSDLMAAVTAIGQASAGDPWVVLLAPGVYDLGTEGLSLGDNVSLVGAGRNETTIRSSGSGSTMYTGANSTVSDLRIEHNNTSAYVTGVHHYGGFDSRLIRVDILAENATTQTEAVLVNYGEMLLQDVDLTAFAGSGTAAGINVQNGADIDLLDSKVLGRFGSWAYGVVGGPGSYVRVTRSDIEGRSANSSWGIYADKSSGEILDSVVHTTAAPTFSAALEVTQPSSGTRQYTVRNSVLEAWDNIDNTTEAWSVIGRASTTIRIGNSQLAGGDPFSAGTMKCAGVYDETFDFSAATCFP